MVRLPHRRAAPEAPDNSGGGWIRSAVVSLLLVLVAAGVGLYVSRSEAHSAAVDQARGTAAAQLAVFEVMQTDLDAMLQWQQKLAPAVSDQGWNVSTADLESLGVVLGPTGLARVEQASQQLDLVFPPGFGAPPESRAAHIAYLDDQTDVRHADDVVRCAEIYLDQPVHPELRLSGSKAKLKTCAREFGVDPPTNPLPEPSVSIYLLKHKRSAKR